jgi:Flp pilus assembly protein TadB
LLKGLQEQQAQIDSLRQRTKRVDAIEDRLAALEADQTPDEQHASEEQPAARWAAGLPMRSLALVLIGMGLGATILHVRRR